MKLNERPIPEPALRDPDSVEMLRVWIAERGLHCALKIGMYRESMNVPEEKAWGRILADVALHIANALKEGYNVDADVALKSIKESFLVELDDEKVTTRGGIVQRH
jgi:hypothetical protein